jgi:hypothetical protein
MNNVKILLSLWILIPTCDTIGTQVLISIDRVFGWRIFEMGENICPYFTIGIKISEAITGTFASY